MEQALFVHHISWENCIGMGLDNTSVNMGCRSSIKNRVLQKNASIYMMGRPGHIVHNTAVKDGEARAKKSNLKFVIMHIGMYLWQKVSGLQVEELLHG